MLEFDASFFEDEVRDGFYVNGWMKRVWATQLEILADLDELCTKHGIRYMADWGTMLGAVRHGGFIPWDDDMDIAMPREDYELFLKVAPEMGGSYRMFDMRYNEEYIDLFGRLVNNGGICMERSHLEKYHQSPFALGIDIFPYDYIYRDEEKEKDRLARFRTIRRVINDIMAGNKTGKQVQIMLRQVESITGRKLTYSTGIIRDLYLCLDAIDRECPASEGDYVVDYNYYTRHTDRYRMPADVFDHLIGMQYENIRVPVPCEYEKILEVEFGDFMRVEQASSDHNYPYYKSQFEVLRKHRPSFYPPYEFVSEDLRIADEPVRLEDVTGDVLFLPYKASLWDKMEPAWRMVRDNPECNAYVVPIPYYEKTWNGSEGQLHYEREDFPEEAGALPLDAYDLKEKRPAAIVYQNGRDDFGDTISVHPVYYSDRLRNSTDRLILIPDLTPDVPDPKNKKALGNMKYYVTMPGVLRADTVYVESAAMRQSYIRKIAEYCNTSEESLQNKVLVEPWSDADRKPKKYRSRERSLQYKMGAPEEWQDKLQKSDGTYKFTVLFEPNASSLASSGELMVDKIADVIDTFRRHKDDICLIMRPAPDFEFVISTLDETLQDRFLGIMEQTVGENWAIFDLTGDHPEIDEIADAYYGDITASVRKFAREGKPVMLQNPDVCDGA